MLAMPAIAAGARPARGAADDGARWPQRTVSWVVGYPAGGPSDAYARLIGPALAGDVRQKVVIENRSGASAIIATESVLRAPADGHTLLTADNGMMVFSPAMYGSLPFDPDTDLAKVSLLVRGAFFLLVRADGPRDFAALQAAARRRPPVFGSAGVSSPHHLAMHLLKRASGLDALDVPHRGIPMVMAELLAGRVDVTVADITSALPTLRTGETRALLVLQETRSALFPDVPTAREAGHDVVATGWQGVCVARGTPAPIVARLDAAIRTAVARPEVTARLRELGTEIAADGPEAFEAFARAENTRWRPLIRELGIRLDR